MTQTINVEEAAKDAVEQAERACLDAVETTPFPYRGFLTFIRQNKRVAGTWHNPVYALIRLPYMRVDGRVKMALDEHREQNASLVIRTDFETDPGSEQLLCKATVTSAFLGTVTAHARVFLNGHGVDATNPMENAETSAVGRALGFLGYGLYGTGIASAEEVLLAGAEREVPVTMDIASGGSETPAFEGKPPSDRQRTFLRKLLEQADIPAEDIDARLEHVATSQEASLLINQLRNRVRSAECGVRSAE